MKERDQRGHEIDGWLQYKVHTFSMNLESRLIVDLQWTDPLSQMGGLFFHLVFYLTRAEICLIVFHVETCLFLVQFQLQYM